MLLLLMYFPKVPQLRSAEEQNSALLRLGICAADHRATALCRCGRSRRLADLGDHRARTYCQECESVCTQAAGNFATQTHRGRPDHTVAHANVASSRLEDNFLLRVLDHLVIVAVYHVGAFPFVAIASQAQPSHLVLLPSCQAQPGYGHLGFAHPRLYCPRGRSITRP